MNSGSGRLATPTFTFLPMKLLGLLPFRLRWLLFRRIDPDFPTSTLAGKKEKTFILLKLLTETEQILTYEICNFGLHLPLVRARTGRFSANLEFESLFTRRPSRITFGARNVEFYSQLILTNPYEVRLATSLSGIRNFRKENPNEIGFFLSKL